MKKGTLDILEQARFQPAQLQPVPAFGGTAKTEYPQERTQYVERGLDKELLSSLEEWTDVSPGIVVSVLHRMLIPVTREHSC